MIILVRDKQKRLDPVMSHYDLLIQIFIDKSGFSLERQEREFKRLWYNDNNNNNNNNNNEMM